MPDRVLLVEDDPKWLAIFTNLIDGSEDFELTFAASTVAEAVQAVKKHPFDAALVDIGLPDGSGHDILPLIAQRQPEMKAAVCTVFEDAENVLRAIRSGASGYILKEHLHTGLIDLLRQMQAGGAPLSPRVARHILLVLQEDDSPADLTEAIAFTFREQEVLRSISAGMTLKQVGQTLGIAESTVRTHVKSIYSKLGVNSRVSAVMEASRRRLV